MENQKINLVLSKNATKLEDFAKEEVIFFFKEICSVEVNVVCECEYKYNDKDQFIFLGRTQEFASNFAQKNKTLKEEVLHDGYIIISKGNRTFLCGGADQGTIFSVYALFKKLFNLEIFTDTLFTYDKKAPEFFDFELQEKPTFPWRALGVYPVHLERKWGDKLGNKRYCYRMRLRQMDEGWGTWGHTFFRVLPPEKYRDAHPDWYNKEGDNLCLTNEEMIAQYVENMKQNILDTPDCFLYGLGGQDTIHFCDCPKCKEVIAKYGVTGQTLLFGIKVVKALNEWIEKEHPERKDIVFVSNAYGYTLIPPVYKDANGKFHITHEELRMPDNMCSKVTAIHGDANRPLYDEKNISYIYKSVVEATHCPSEIPTRDIILGWDAIQKICCIDMDNINFFDITAPNPYWSTIEDNYRWLKELNCYATFTEAGLDSILNFSAMKVYCMSQIMWNTDLKMKDLVPKFAKLYYQSAYKEVLEYFNFIHAHAEWLYTTYGKKLLFANYDEPLHRRWLDKLAWSKDVLMHIYNIFEKIDYSKLSKEVYDRVMVEAVNCKWSLMYLYRDELDRDFKLKLLKDCLYVEELHPDMLGLWCTASTVYLSRWAKELFPDGNPEPWCAELFKERDYTKSRAHILHGAPVHRINYYFEPEQY